MRAKYVMSEVFLGLWRNISMTVAMIITMTVSLTMLGGGLLLYNQVEVIEEYYQTNLEVVVYLQRDVAQDISDQIGEDLKASPYVEQAVYESKEEAYTRFKETFADTPDLVDSVDAEVLPSAWRIKMKDIADAPKLIAEFQEREGVYQVTNQREILQEVFNILGGFQKAAFGLAIFMGAAMILLVANTIQVAAFSRRREVAIMKLVGAPNWFVQAPFVLEAVFAGTLGAIFAFLMILSLYLLGGGSELSQVLELLPPVKMQAVLLLLPILVGVSAVISAITAWITLRFNIKV